MYLLGNPDHYTDHKFHTFFWRGYVFEARRPWMMDTDSQKLDKVTIRNNSSKLIAITPVQDYTFQSQSQIQYILKIIYPIQMVILIQTVMLTA